MHSLAQKYKTYYWEQKYIPILLACGMHRPKSVEHGLPQADGGVLGPAGVLLYVLLFRAYPFLDASEAANANAQGQFMVILKRYASPHQRLLPCSSFRLQWQIHIQTLARGLMP